MRESHGVCCTSSSFIFMKEEKWKRVITKMKKKRLGILTKNSQKPNFSPIGPVDPEIWACTDRHTHTHTHIHPHIKKALFRTRGVLKRVNPSKVGGRVFGAITILPLAYCVVLRESKNIDLVLVPPSMCQSYTLLNEVLLLIWNTLCNASPELKALIHRDMLNTTLSSHIVD